MKSLLLVAAMLSSTAGAAFAELQSSPGVPEGLILGANGHGQLHFDPNAGMVRAVPGTVIVPDAAGRYLNPRAPGGPQRVGRALTNTDAPLAVLGLPFDAEGILLDLANPFSGDGFGSRGSVGRGLTSTGVIMPGRFIGGPGGSAAVGASVGSGLGAAFGGPPGFFVGGVAGSLFPLVDYMNPLSGDGYGSYGNAGRSLGFNGVPYSPQMAPVVMLDTLSPFSGDGVGSPGVVGRGLVPYGAGQRVAVPGRWLKDTGVGLGSLIGTGAGLVVGTLAGVAGVEAPLVVVGGVMLVDDLNPWSGGGVDSIGSVGRGLGVPGGFAGQVPYYSTGNAGMVPVQYDVGPQGTTISITIPNGYNVGQMGMMPMVPAMSTPQYRVIPQYAAPAPVAYAAPATPANLAVAPPAANAGVKCQVGDQQAVAPTVDACEEAGGLVQPMDTAQPAE